MKKIFTVLVIIIFAGLTFSVFNTKLDSHDNMMTMIKFIEKNTDLKYNGEQLPTVKISTQEEMCRVLFDMVPDPCHIAGYYDDETNEIVLGSEPTVHMVADHFQEVILAHELVHFLQKTNGVYETIECRRALEKDAFKIQELWVDHNQLHHKQKPDPLFSLLISSCPTPLINHLQTH